MTRDYQNDEGPMRCNDCDRPIYYDYSVENYFHATEPERGCFLIAASDRPADSNHPLVSNAIA